MGVSPGTAGGVVIRLDFMPYFRGVRVHIPPPGDADRAAFQIAQSAGL